MTRDRKKTDLGRQGLLVQISTKREVDKQCAVPAGIFRYLVTKFSLFLSIEIHVSYLELLNLSDDQSGRKMELLPNFRKKKKK